jgi:formate dehydrogenase subunit gamma
VLVVPLNVTDIAGQQLSRIIHGLLSVTDDCRHAGAYLHRLPRHGGAIDAMASGEVDVNCAKEHHALWVENELAKARQTFLAGARAAGAD